MATYEGGDAEGPPGRHPARGARAGAGTRLRDHGSAAGTQRRPGRPADRHGVSGLAPPGTGGPGPGELVSSRRAPPPRLPAHPGGPPGPGHRAQHLAGLLGGRFRAPAARAASGELAMSRQGPPEPGTGPAGERYVGEVQGPAGHLYLSEDPPQLPGPPPRAHSGIVAELLSGLLDAADAHRSAGLPPAL